MDYLLSSSPSDSILLNPHRHNKGITAAKLRHLFKAHFAYAKIKVHRKGD
jgi:hypothetical protein